MLRCTRAVETSGKDMEGEVQSCASTSMGIRGCNPQTVKVPSGQIRSRSTTRGARQDAGTCSMELQKQTQAKGAGRERTKHKL